jgi:hypothetical protein
LTCYPETTNGTYFGDGKAVTVMVRNNGSSDSAPCTIGVGFKDQVTKGKNIKWVGKATVPKIFSQQHVYVAVPGQFMVLPPEAIYVAAVDIDDDVAEQGGEDNNISKPFTYDRSSVGKTTSPPKGKPFQAFEIVKPAKDASLPIGSDVAIDWYPTQALNNLPPEARAAYWKVDISLVSEATGDVVAQLGRNVNNRPINGLHGWRVTLPSSLAAGQYHIRLDTPFGSGWGQSGMLSLYEGTLAQAALALPNGVKGPQAQKTQKAEHANLSPGEADAKALKFKHWQIKSIIPKTVVLNGSLGPYARLTSIRVVVEYDANKPFKLAPSLEPTDTLKPDAVWSLAVPRINVNGGLAEKSTIDQIHGSHSSTAGGFVDPTGSYPWHRGYQIGGGVYAFDYPKGILPKGRNTFTLVLNEAGVAHGLEVVGKALKWETYLQGVVKKKKSYLAKCTRSFYPHFNVQVQVGVYMGGWNSSGSFYRDTMTYGFKKPPVWQHLNPWETTYFGQDKVPTGIPTFSAEDCQ